MKNIETSDDVLTLLAHLGYLSYNPETQSVMIPNTEISSEFKNAVSKHEVEMEVIEESNS